MNFYEMNPNSYNKLIPENVTKTYKKAGDKLVGKLDEQSAKTDIQRPSNVPPN